ncbi:hypothetical protein CUC08_Gglean003155 [Alternaria sp. MG1]|nr:hypothetical protein CUC08_Gglean003155 [Alternaria sp. MG1]
MVLGMVSLAVQSSLPLHILLLAPLFRFDRRWFAVVSWWPIVLLARRFPPLPPQAVSQSLQAFAQERRRGLAVGPDVSSGSRALCSMCAQPTRVTAGSWELRYRRFVPTTKLLGKSPFSLQRY